MLENKPLNDTGSKNRINPLAQLWIKFIRFSFFLLYNQLAFTYDAVSWIVSLGLWRDWQRTALPYVRGSRVLELAHGPGHMLKALKQSGFQVTGVDLSPHMGRLAKGRLAKSQDIVDLVRCPAQHLPFKANAFDCVLSTFPSEFILDNSTLLSVHHILRREGLFIIVPSAQLTGTTSIVKGIEWLYYITGQRSFSSTGTQENLQKETAEQHLKNIFEVSGFNLQLKNIAVKDSLVTLLLAQKTN